MNNKRLKWPIFAIIVGLLLVTYSTYRLLYPPQSTTDTQSGEQSTPSKPTNNKGDISIRLIDSATGNPLAGVQFEFISDNGTRCVTTPCPTNTQSLSVSSDTNGVITVPRNIVQASNFVQNDTYTSDELDVTSDTDEYTLNMIKR